MPEPTTRQKWLDRFRGRWGALAAPGVFGAEMFRNVSGLSGEGSGGSEWDEFIAALAAAMQDGDGDGGGGGGYTQPWSSTQAALQMSQQFEAEQARISREYDALEVEKNRAFQSGEREEAQKFQERQDKLRRDFDALESEKNREFQRWQAKEQLKAERQRIFSEMRGKDPVRAALFAMGVGGEILPGGERFEDLPALKGAKTYAGKATEALTKLLPRKAGQEAISIGEYGVTGLAPAVKSATAFQRAGAGGKTVLGSAYGVGDIRAGRQPGYSPEEYAALVESVTPRGSLSY